MKTFAFGPSLVLFTSATMLAQSKAPEPIELTHIDVTLVDSAIDPCNNFYQYTCSKLNAAHPIPADQVSSGGFRAQHVEPASALHDLGVGPRSPLHP